MNLRYIPLLAIIIVAVLSCDKEYTCTCSYDEQSIKEIVQQNAQGVDSVVGYDTLLTPLTQSYTYKSNKTLANESCQLAEEEINSQINSRNVSCSI